MFPFCAHWTWQNHATRDKYCSTKAQLESLFRNSFIIKISLSVIIFDSEDCNKLVLSRNTAGGRGFYNVSCNVVTWEKKRPFLHKTQYCVNFRAITTSYYYYVAVLHIHLMHPNYYQITTLLVVDLCSSLAYFMMTHPFPIASKLHIKNFGC